MPKTIPVTTEDVEWLRDAYQRGVPFSEMATRIGACVDTTKRILARNGIAEFEAAKYTVARRREEKKWTRPCLRCRSTERRHVGLYLCSKCRVAEY